MRNEPKIDVQNVAHHRNGVGGAPFHTVLFTCADGPMVGIVFAEQGAVAILNRDRLTENDIDFGSNSWRGDLYEKPLRRAIREWAPETNENYENRAIPVRSFGPIQMRADGPSTFALYDEHGDPIRGEFTTRREAADWICRIWGDRVHLSDVEAGCETWREEAV